MTPRYRQSATIVTGDNSGNLHYLKQSFDIKEQHIKSQDTFQFDDDQNHQQVTSVDLPFSNKSLSYEIKRNKRAERCLMLNFFCQFVIISGVLMSLFWLNWLDIEPQQTLYYDSSQQAADVSTTNLTVEVKIITIRVSDLQCLDKAEFYDMFSLSVDQSACPSKLSSADTLIKTDDFCELDDHQLPKEFCNHLALHLISSYVVLFLGFTIVVINFYGLICGICQMKGAKSYYLTVTVPFKFCWFLYAIVISAWTLLNALQFKYVDIGWWVFLGCTLLSLILKYHYSKFTNELKKIRNFILFMRDL